MVLGCETVRMVQLPRAQISRIVISPLSPPHFSSSTQQQQLLTGCGGVVWVVMVVGAVKPGKPSPSPQPRTLADLILCTHADHRRVAAAVTGAGSIKSRVPAHLRG
jgi:hypothetical protein